MIIFFNNNNNIYRIKIFSSASWRGTHSGIYSEGLISKETSKRGVLASLLFNQIERIMSDNNNNNNSSYSGSNYEEERY